MTCDSWSTAAATAKGACSMHSSAKCHERCKKKQLKALKYTAMFYCTDEGSIL
jgi:hypothetical protein